MLSLRPIACLAVIHLGGCATIAGNTHQSLAIEVLDARHEPVVGMHCTMQVLREDTAAAGSGIEAAPAVAATHEMQTAVPAASVTVPRSRLPLAIACRRGEELATATVHPRREGLEQALVPFGSVGVFIDHVSGNLYGYPTGLQLRVGHHLKLEHGEQARVVTARELPGAVIAESAAPPTVLAMIRPTDTLAGPPVPTAAERAAAQRPTRASSRSTRSNPPKPATARKPSAAPGTTAVARGTDDRRGPARQEASAAAQAAKPRRAPEPGPTDSALTVAAAATPVAATPQPRTASTRGAPPATAGRGTATAALEVTRVSNAGVSSPYARGATVTW